MSIADQGRSFGNITISAGVATFPKNGSLPAQLLAAADAALYQAKVSGRNRVKVAGELLSPSHTISPRLGAVIERTETEILR
jgi:predicted signal transduction protein with EAL and GGDEF domain